MPLRDSLRPARALPLRVVLPPPLAKEIVIAPLTIKQTADCLMLDPKEGAAKETEHERVVRLCGQAEIMLGPEHAYLTGVLTVEQIGEIVAALYLSARGVDPTDFLTVQKHLREQRITVRSPEEALAQVQDLTMGLAADLGTTPEHIETMPITDAVSLAERRAEKATAAARFDAGLHGIELPG